MRERERERWNTARVGDTNCVYYFLLGIIGHSLHSMVTHLTITFLPSSPSLSLSHSQKQLQDYTAWVNNYLKRKPGTPLVTDLRANLQDGLTFINLVEIVGKEKSEEAV